MISNGQNYCHIEKEKSIIFTKLSHVSGSKNSGCARNIFTLEDL
jgi:hypothetical protein